VEHDRRSIVEQFLLKRLELAEHYGSLNFAGVSCFHSILANLFEIFNSLRNAVIMATRINSIYIA